MRFRLTLVAALALSVLAFTAVRAAEPKDLVGKDAPDFTLTTLDGKTVKLSEQKGSVVLLDFWATWCGPCVKALPHVQKLSADKDRAEKGLKVWAVNAREKNPTIQKFIDDNKYTFGVPLDTSGEVMKSYNVSGIPTTVVVGKDGKVAKTFVGYSDANLKQLDAAIDEALKK
jgi:peroxiredoxin